MKKVHTIYYSPTATSRKIARELALRLAENAGAVSEHDMTSPPGGNNGSSAGISAADLAVIAAPVYAGRVAPLAAERLQSLQGADTPAAIVVLYGNRAYEDALLELYDIATRQSFKVVAAAAFIGEHSFSSPDMPIGHGRPDKDDLAKARDFARRVQKKLAATPAAVCDRTSLPGNDPFKEGVGNIPLTPKVDVDLCTLCGQCSEVCPAGAIEINDQVQIVVEPCTFCCACIKNCPESALSMGDAAPVIEKKQWLHQNCAARREPEFFL